MTAEEARESSRAAGGCVLVFLAAAVVAAVFAASAEGGILTVLGLGTAALWWAVRRPNKIHNPSPPPPDTPLENEKPQFSVIPDRDNPHRSHIVWHAR